MLDCQYRTDRLIGFSLRDVLNSDTWLCNLTFVCQSVYCPLFLFIATPPIQVLKHWLVDCTTLTFSIVYVFFNQLFCGCVIARIIDKRAYHVYSYIEDTTQHYSFYLCIHVVRKRYDVSLLAIPNPEPAHVFGFPPSIIGECVPPLTWHRGKYVCVFLDYWKTVW